VDVVYGLIPMMLFFGFLVVVVFIWMAKSGQFDDLDGAANSIFMDDEYEDNEELVESAKKESLEEKEKVKNHQGGDKE
jgi:cbb3-type cytochrome oxidase maturation protein